VDTADPANVEIVKANAKKVNPDATIIEAASPITVEDSTCVKGMRVLVVEDGPTLTHGNMAYGAGTIAAKKLGAKEIVDPRPYAVGSIRDTFKKYTHLGALLPAMGYGDKQVDELEKTINAAPCDLVIIGTPVDLRRILSLNKPAVRARYELQEVSKPDIEEILRKRFLKKK